ncbi:MAG: hypothetical protein LUG98_03435 [Tannerellaceae bacterium]|nr:hypothetical protein [Tannerellaceae bacterium]
MKREILSVNFIATLQKKIPNKTLLTNKLVDILMIEKDAIYRRLRGDVPFTFAEVAILSQQLGISLDELLGIHSDKKLPFHLQITDYEYPSETDYIMYDNYNQVLDVFIHHPPFIVSETWNTIPFPLCYNYPLLTQFYIYKWAYQTYNYVPLKRFEETTVEEKLIQLGQKNSQLLSLATETHYIFSDNLFSALVKDLKFLSNLRLVSRESLQGIYAELDSLMNYLEECARRGEYKETGNKLYFYISELDIQTHYSLLAANNNYICMLRTLVMGYAATTDSSIYPTMNNWFTALKRLSTHISVSGEKERIQYFKQQREIIDKLKE